MSFGSESVCPQASQMCCDRDFEYNYSMYLLQSEWTHALLFKIFLLKSIFFDHMTPPNTTCKTFECSNETFFGVSPIIYLVLCLFFDLSTV